MSSTFGGLNTALTALYAQRHGMNIAAQNVANANTEGYTRQRVDLDPIGGAAVPAMHSLPDVAGGKGVRVSDVTRMRDAFLESRGRAEHAESSYRQSTQELYTRIENVFAEPSDTALGTQLADLWAGFSDVANRPGDTAARSALLQRAGVVVDGLRAGYDALASQWDSSRVQLDGLAKQLNNAADAVAQLNQAIIGSQAAGLPTNELRDERDLRLMELAELGGITTLARENGAVDVLLGGSTLVGGSISRHVGAIGANRLQDQPGAPVTIEWADNHLGATVVRGKIGASLETLNGHLPTYAAKLDSVAVTLANDVNTVHRTGYGLDGSTNQDLFVDTSGSLGITARTIGVGISAPQRLAVSAVNGTFDGSKAAAMAKAGTGTTGPDATYRAMIVDLGVQAQTAQRRAGIQAQVTADMDALRSADSGVNLDEEMTNLISYQKAYEAAARVMTSLDEALDTLINRTGLVGR